MLQLLALRQEVEKLRDKVIVQRDACDERVAKAVKEARETNERSLQERTAFQSERLRLNQQIQAEKRVAEKEEERASVRIAVALLSVTDPGPLAQCCVS